MKPHVAFAVENKLSEDFQCRTDKVDLRFKSLEDFEHRAGARQVETAEGIARSQNPAERFEGYPADQRKAG